MTIRPLDALNSKRFDTPAILRKVASASRQLAELKGVAGTIPNQGILINALGLREAKDSSAIENIVSTHQDGILAKQNRSNYYINTALYPILTEDEA